MVTAVMKSEDDCFLAGKQTSVLKSRERRHSAKKGPYSQGYGRLVVMYGCEIWTIKKAEHQRIGDS